MNKHAFFDDDGDDDHPFEQQEWLAVALAAVICVVIAALAMPWPV